MSLNWNFQRGGGFKQKPFVGEVWIFSGITHLDFSVCVCVFFFISKLSWQATREYIFIFYVH